MLSNFRISIVAGCAFSLVAATLHGQESATATNPAVVPVSRNAGTKWIANGYKKMDSELAKRDLASIDIVFVGDSITRHWSNKDQGRKFWDESFPNALNLGMGGDRTEHVLYRLKSKAEGGRGNFDDDLLQPKFIVLMIGTNNLFKHDASQIIAGIKAVVTRLQELRPKAKLILCSVLPTHKIDLNQEKVIPVNKAIHSIEGVEWIDLFSDFYEPMEDEKKIAYYKDGLHLNASGYEVWRDLLIDFIEGNR